MKRLFRWRVTSFVLHRIKKKSLNFINAPSYIELCEGGIIASREEVFIYLKSFDILLQYLGLSLYIYLALCLFASNNGLPWLWFMGKCYVEPLVYIVIYSLPFLLINRDFEYSTFFCLFRHARSNDIKALLLIDNPACSTEEFMLIILPLSSNQTSFERYGGNFCIYIYIIAIYLLYSLMKTCISCKFSKIASRPCAYLY